MNINTTDCNYFDKLKSLYKNKVIKGKKSNSEILEHLNIISVTEKNLDYMGMEILSEEIKFRNIKESECVFNIYQLIYDKSSKKFYDYYRKRYENMLNIYIYHEVKSDTIFSNCTLLDLYMTILKGIEEIHIENSSKEYLIYLDTLYQYEKLLNN